MIYKGSFYDGILNVIVDSKNDLGKNISICVHTSGGTFGKSKSKIKKQINRINKLKLLNKALVKDKSHNVLIMGDFNMDSNDIKHYPELKFSPEYKFKNIHDVWKSMKPKMIGATEDEFINTVTMKIKELIKEKLDMIKYYTKVKK